MSAMFSDDGLYRYSLRRDLESLIAVPEIVTFVMLNPSTADAVQDDPTIRRCIGFAREWGYSTLLIGNLYAYRSTDPRELWKVDDPVGRPVNDIVLQSLFQQSDLIVAAWGTNAKPDRVAEVMSWPVRPWRCLSRTKNGSPRHPLYAPKAPPHVEYSA